MSHAGPPSEPPPDPNENESGEGRPSPPDPSGQQPYNPYPDNWETSGRSSGQQSPYGEPSPYGQPGPYGQQDPYGQAPSGQQPPYAPQSPYAAPGQPGSPANPYAGTAASWKPTFGFGGYAGWFTRVGAYLIDYILGTLAAAPALLGYAILAANTSTITNPDGTTTTHYSGSTALPIILLVIGGITGIAFYVWNVCIKQGRTGATVGKGVLAIRLVNSDLQPIGPGWSFLRSILHIIDGLPCICLPLGYLWPIWDSRKQTFADKIMSTFVIQATAPQPPVY